MPKVTQRCVASIVPVGEIVAVDMAVVAEEVEKILEGDFPTTKQLADKKGSSITKHNTCKNITIIAFKKNYYY